MGTAEQWDPLLTSRPDLGPLRPLDQSTLIGATPTQSLHLYLIRNAARHRCRDTCHVGLLPWIHQGRRIITYV